MIFKSLSDETVLVVATCQMKIQLTHQVKEVLEHVEVNLLGIVMTRILMNPKEYI